MLFLVSGKVDVNHDGISDLIIGSPYASPNSKSIAGTTTVIFGRKTWKGEIDTLTDINGTNGFKLLGENSGNYSGRSVSSAGDVNSDGIQDFIIGANGWNSHAGRAFVVYGQSVSQCPMKMYLNGGTCKNCTVGNGCLNCSGKTGECTSCPSGKVVSGTGC